MFYLTDGTTIEEYEFYNESKEDFYKKEFPEAKLVCGKYRNPLPSVTVIIPTYKRPKLLSEAVNSALNQNGFSDYQILVVDNEAAPIECETETSEYIKKLGDERIVYYRNITSAFNKMDNCVHLAKTEWILFLHDDDILDPDSLRIQWSVVNEIKDITYLAVPSCSFKDTLGSSEKNNMNIDKGRIHKVIEYPRDHLKSMYFPGWLGGLIRKDDFINVGGICRIPTGLGDYIFVQKYFFLKGIYELKLDIPLYYYRYSDVQMSATATNWENSLINKFYYLCYVLNKLNVSNKSIWYRFLVGDILASLSDVKRGRGIDVEKRVKEACRITDYNENGVIKVLLKNYYKIYNCIAYLRAKKCYVREK